VPRFVRAFWTRTCADQDNHHRPARSPRSMKNVAAIMRMSRVLRMSLLKAHHNQKPTRRKMRKPKVTVRRKKTSPKPTAERRPPAKRQILKRKRQRKRRRPQKRALGRAVELLESVAPPLRRTRRRRPPQRKPKPERSRPTLTFGGIETAHLYTLLFQARVGYRSTHLNFKYPVGVTESRRTH